jgi:ribosomal-protein-alanine N-acetyltransferase
MRLRPLEARDADALAVVHAASFAHPWPAEEIRDLVMTPGGYGVVCESPGSQTPAAGFILCRAIAGDAEVLTLAVAPSHRRRGLGLVLIEAAAGLALGLGAEALFLEVADDNAPAIALYESAGFERVGRRRGYYAKGRRTPADAFVYRRALNSGPG